MRPCLWVVVVGALANAATSSAADGFPPVQVVDHMERYVITGSSLRSINAELEKHSGASPAPGSGSTSSEIELATRLELVGDRCRISQLDVRLEVTTRLPDWRPARKPSRSVRKQWAESATILTRHEAGHREHAVQAAEALRKTLIALAPMKDCQRVDTAVGIELQTALQHLDSRELRYDTRTQGGLRDDPLGDKGNSPK